MFGIQFYPTPDEVILEMLHAVNIKGKIVLEPSAGKGDILDMIKDDISGIACCEIDPNLRSILKSKNYNLIGDDFLTMRGENISHIDIILMNPPFRNGDEHLIHAFEIAPEGTEIVCLLNHETIDNSYSKKRKSLSSLIELHGYHRNLGNCFEDSENKTNVNVSMVYLKKPYINPEQEFDGFFTEEIEEEQFDGIMRYDYIRDLVNRYIGACRLYDKQIELATQMNQLLGKHFETKVGMSLNIDGIELSKIEFKKDLQKSAWNSIIGKLDLHKFATSKLRKDINRFIEKQTHIPFTMRNIYHMLEMIIGTHQSRMDNALTDVVEKMTKYTEENRWNVEGWISNSSYMLNQLFIMPYLVEVGFNGKPTYKSSPNLELLDDLQRALCYYNATVYNYNNSFSNVFGRYAKIVDTNDKTVRELTEREYVRLGSLSDGNRAVRLDVIEFGKWFEWEFFEVKIHKKGTAHFRFKDESLWIRVNSIVAEKFGFPLPEKTKSNKTKK
jgi:hypothetical protein